MASPSPYSGADLLDFVNHKMAMAANYQPVIIQALIHAPGHRMPAFELARQLLLHDSFAVAKARRTLMRWPKLTLGAPPRGRGIAFYDRATREFFLPVEFDGEEQRDQVLAACADAISNWEKKEAPKVASQFYKLVEAAGGRCQACGVLGSVRPLDIDHVIPRDKARHGYVTLPDKTRVPADDGRNLQVLCSRCNRGKRDTSTYDFRPSPERLADTIRLTLELAAQSGYDREAVLNAALSSTAPPA